MKYAWDFQLCLWFSVALKECVSLTPDVWEVTGMIMSIINLIFYSGHRNFFWTVNISTAVWNSFMPLTKR